MTLQEIAADLGITDSALRHAIRRGELVAEKAGTTYVVTDEQYQTYLQARHPRGWPKGKKRGPRRRPEEEQK